jgi:hypothetical protein
MRVLEAPRPVMLLQPITLLGEMFHPPWLDVPMLPQNPRCLVLVPGSLAHDAGIGGTQPDGATCSNTYLFWLEGPNKSDSGADARDRGPEAWEGHNEGTSVHCMRYVLKLGLHKQQEV